MQAVNLLPAYARPGRRWASLGKEVPARKALRFGGIAAGVAAVALGAGYAYERSVVNNNRTELNDATARLTAVEAAAAPIRAAETQATSELAAVRSISQSRVPWE